jgi:hypothetical protein
METYSFDYEKGRNRSIRVSAETGDVAKAAAALLVKSIQRKQEDREAVKELTAVAIQRQKLADEFRWKGPTGEAIRQYHLAKSREAIEAAARIIAEGER